MTPRAAESLKTPQARFWRSSEASRTTSRRTQWRKDADPFAQEGTAHDHEKELYENDSAHTAYDYADEGTKHDEHDSNSFDAYAMIRQMWVGCFLLACRLIPLLGVSLWRAWRRWRRQRRVGKERTLAVLQCTLAYASDIACLIVDQVG